MNYELVEETEQLEDGYIKETTYKLYDTGEKVEVCSVTYKPEPPTPEPEPTPMPNPIEELQEQVTELQMALCEQYEENLALQEEVTNTQLAIVELYEGGMLNG